MTRWPRLMPARTLLGFVLYREVPRKMIPKPRRQIARKLPARIEKVGVFVDQTLSRCAKGFYLTGLNAEQVHGARSKELPR